MLHVVFWLLLFNESSHYVLAHLIYENVYIQESYEQLVLLAISERYGTAAFCGRVSRNLRPTCIVRGLT